MNSDELVDLKNKEIQKKREQIKALQEEIKMLTYTKKGVSKNIKEHLKAMGFKQSVLNPPNDNVSYVVRCCCFSSDSHKVPLPRDMTDEDFQLYEKIMMEIIDVLAKYKRERRGRT